MPSSADASVFVEEPRRPVFFVCWDLDVGNFGAGAVPAAWLLNLGTSSTEHVFPQSGSVGGCALSSDDDSCLVETAGHPGTLSFFRGFGAGVPSSASIPKRCLCCGMTASSSSSNFCTGGSIRSSWRMRVVVPPMLNLTERNPMETTMNTVTDTAEKGLFAPVLSALGLLMSSDPIMERSFE